MYLLPCRSALLAAIPTITALPTARVPVRAPEQPVLRDIPLVRTKDFSEGLGRIARISLLQAHQISNAKNPATAAESLALNPSSDALLEAIKRFAVAYEDLVKEAGSREPPSEEAMVESFETDQVLANGLCVNVGPFVRVCV